MFHETGHIGQLPGLAGGVEVMFTHQTIDAYARRLLMNSGLGGGGCVATGRFPGC
jgi:hypothetical protein